MTRNSFLVLIVISFVNPIFAQKESKQPSPVAVGETAPDFELIGMDGKKVKLTDRFGKKGHPVILLFSRAHW